jgi:hypothetical protein
MVVLAMSLLIAAADYKKFYDEVPVAQRQYEALPPPAEPEVRDVANLTEAIDRLWAEGFGHLGTVGFEGVYDDEKPAIKFGRKLGAGLVVIQSPKFTNDVTIGGTGPLTGFSISRYDQHIGYFLAAKKTGSGLFVKAIEPEMAKDLGVNRGVYVRSVRRGSPAYNVDILPGDVVQLVGATGVYDIASFIAAMKAVYGQSSEIKIIRKGQPVTIVLTLSADGTW